MTYLLRAFDENGDETLRVDLDCGSFDAETRFEREMCVAKRQGHYVVLLTNEFGNVREFAR